MHINHTLTFFGIEIDKSFFGKKPAGDYAKSMLDSFSPAYTRQQAFGGDHYKQVNQYGEGFFKPFDVVPLSDFSGDMTLEYGLKVFNLSDFEKLYLGGMYMARSTYGNSSMRSGVEDRLLEQMVYWLAN